MKKPVNERKFTDLPYDVQALILSKVGEESHPDLVQCILTCKTFRDLSKYLEVLQKLRLDQTYPLPMERIPENSKLLLDCAKAGNAHTVFLCGLIDYFLVNDTVTGSKNLKSAADANHPEAMYLYGMVLILENQVNEGSAYLELLRKERGIDAVRGCQDNCRSVVLDMSVRQYREFEMLLAIMEIGDNCVVADFNEVCDNCFIYKEISRFIDYMNHFEAYLKSMYHIWLLEYL